jgi:eukaryotic-like serine/threonine-protein kinase
MKAMRNALRYLLLALVLLIVALISAVTAMRLAIHGREVMVPDLRGKTPLEARSLAEQVGLGARVESSYYSQTVPQGRVLSEMPPAGTFVRRGWEIRLALSLGPQRVAIPRVVGESERAAGMTLVERGLELGWTDRTQMPGAAAGQVLAQNPQPNATHVSAPKISLLVAEPSSPEALVMPSFVGQPLGSVTTMLASAGLTLGKVVVQAPSTPVPDGLAPPGPAEVSTPAAVVSPASVVVSQDPGPGEKVYAESAVNFVVR